MRRLIAMVVVCGLMVFGAGWAWADESGKEADRYPPKLMFDDQSLDFELRRMLGAVVTGGGDVNEILYTAAGIEPGDGDSWYEAWYGLGERVYAIGLDCLEKGRPVSAREAFLRASMYFRSADFYLHGDPDDPRIVESWRKSRESFRRGAALLTYPVEPVEIPYQDTTLPGYIVKPDASDRPRKTLILQTGFDGTGEEIFFTRGVFAVRRGYNVLIFEGPGQGGVVREQKLYFRPDWEKVVTPVVDFALTRPEFDPDKLALMGISLGGYLAPRAAAYEHRLAALVANGGVWDWGLQPGETQADVAKDVAEMKEYPKQTNEFLRKKMAESIGFRWSINNGMFTFGVDSPVEFALGMEDYSMVGRARLIQCPTLVIHSVDDQFFVGQPKMLYDALTREKTYMTFTRDEMASSHCQVGAFLISAQKVFDWLDATLEGKR
jgi:dipeptidyl aminopeptidase/acylaminoacyl peptidase